MAERTGISRSRRPLTPRRRRSATLADTQPRDVTLALVLILLGGAAWPRHLLLDAAGEVITGPMELSDDLYHLLYRFHRAHEAALDKALATLAGKDAARIKLPHQRRRPPSRCRAAHLPGDDEMTAESADPRPLPHRQYPCSECPWRRDTPPGQFTSERYAAMRETSEHRTVITAEDITGQPMFACHKGDPATGGDGDLACAGWLAAAGNLHIGVRVAVAFGALPASALEPQPGWPDLYDTHDEMAAAQARDDDERGETE